MAGPRAAHVPYGKPARALQDARCIDVMGEPPSVPVAADIANAVFDACGARVRTLPITAKAVRDALGRR